MVKWAAVQMVVGYVPIGTVEAETEDEAKALAREMMNAAPAQDPCPTCKVKRWSQGVGVKENEDA